MSTVGIKVWIIMPAKCLMKWVRFVFSFEDFVGVDGLFSWFVPLFVLIFRSEYVVFGDASRSWVFICN